MKVAIVCDDLIQWGGAEEVVKGLSEIFPEAPIYTTIATKKWKKYFGDKNRMVTTSFLQKFPFAVFLNRYYSVFNLHVLAIESFDFRDYDLVVSCSSRYAHFSITRPTTKHFCYLNTPGRMFWEPREYFDKETFGVSAFLKRAAYAFISPYLTYIRLADKAAFSRIDAVVSNSITTQNRLKKYFNIESKIIYPFFRKKELSTNDIDNEKYFLVLTRLVSWKKVDIAIKACNELNLRLKIIGRGPDLSRLKALAGKNVEFYDNASDEQKWLLLSRCSALINTQKEDFGIVPLEAMSVGKPVVAYGKGGAMETVQEGTTGIFFEEQTVESLKRVLSKFDSFKFNPENCRRQADKFSFELFKSSILGRVTDLICTHS